MSRNRRIRRIVTGFVVVVPALSLACADPPTTPRVADPASIAAVSDRSDHASQPLAAIAWEMTARDLVASHPTVSPLAGARIYALLGVAQYGAASAADFGGGRAQDDALRGAIGGASVEVLTYLFPDAAAALEQQLAADGNARPGGTSPHFTRGVATGRATGDAMRAWGAADGFSLPWDHAVLPSGPGLWIAVPNVAPAGFQFPTLHPYFLTSASQFRPSPPPAFGSAEFLAGLAAVRLASDTRGQAETDIANFWNLSNGTPTPAGYWAARGAGLLAAQHAGERDAAHLFALMNASELDALIGCFEAKYHYLLMRPSQADPLITRPIGPPGFPYALPNHPSYPSGHSCASAAAVTVLESWFPSQTTALDAELAQAGLSRVLGGIHYPFDVAAGQALGRATAHWAMDYDADRGLLTEVGLASDAYATRDNDRDGDR